MTTRRDLDRARTALRDASLDYGVHVAGGSKRRTGSQAGRDALRRLDAAITYLTAARGSLAAAIADEAAPVAPGAASDPKKGITS